MKLYKITFTVTEERFVAAETFKEAQEMSLSIEPDFDGEARVDIRVADPEKEDQGVLLDGVDGDVTIADFIAFGHQIHELGERERGRR